MEKLWGGIPVDPIKAFQISFDQLKSVGDYKVLGKIEVEVSETTGEKSTEALLNETAQKILAVFPNKEGFSTSKVLGQSTELSFGETVPGDSQAINLEANFESFLTKKGDYQFTIELDPKSLPTSFSNTLGIPETSMLKLEAVTKDQKVYLRIPALSIWTGSENNKWLSFDLKDLKSIEKIKEEGSKKNYQYLQWVKEGERKNIEKILGVSAYHYHLVFDSSKIFQDLDKSYASMLDTTKGSYNAEADFWISVKDRLLRQVKLTFSGQDQDQKVTVMVTAQFSDFGQAKNIQAPDPNLVDSEGLQSLLKPYLGGEIGTSQTKSKDAQRKTHLRSLKTALEMYRVDKDSYPKSKGIEKTNSPGNVLGQALVPTYIKTLPVDPQEPQYYYGYQSDGTTYQLTCLLENASDGASQKIGERYLFKLVPD